MKNESLRFQDGADNDVELLSFDPDTGFRVTRRRLSAGFVAPKHRHSDFEWVYIIEGQLEDEFGSYPQGTFKINAKGSVHKSRSQNGCTLLTFTRAHRESIDES